MFVSCVISHHPAGSREQSMQAGICLSTNLLVKKEEDEKSLVKNVAHLASATSQKQNSTTCDLLLSEASTPVSFSFPYLFASNDLGHTVKANKEVASPVPMP